ncbi:uncharacterized protein LOC127851492 isoform X1 [Dreissena polymorpha]|uniref:uncharacterized protein LOC127851492 isoform X1 n=1 Tax=Dreissena polymorpha TaxID=45954 RepID=UPI0022655972|nr:uncharacterized protein LOC127851492 isoform X1 [Dreissena polymorpha]
MNKYRHLEIIKHTCACRDVDVIYVSGECLPSDDVKWTVNDPTSWPNVTYEDLVDYLVMAKAYDGKAMKSFRSLYAYNYVQNGWLGDIMWSSHNNIQFLKAKVSPSQPGVGRADYMAWVAIADDSTILTGYCTCPAGTGRSCSHISAIIYAVALAWNHGLAGKTCTDKDRLWGRGAGTAVLHEEFENINFERPKPDDAPILKKTQKKATGTQLPKIRSFLDHSDLQDHASESCTNKLWTCKGTLLQKILSAKEKPVNEMKSVEHSDHTIDPSRPVNEVTCQPCDAFYKKYINLSAEAKTNISQATSLQCSTLWSDARKLRISSSKVHALPKTSRADPNKFVTNQIYPRFKGNSATQHGQKYEAEARAWFEQNTGLKVVQTGVVIDQTEPYLAASPDGLVGEDTILEIKCPTKPLRELIQSGTYDVVPTKSGDHCLNPKGRNGYYTQVQIAMHCTTRHHCKFVVWTKAEGLIVDVPYDANFVRIREFYFKHLLVRLVDEHNFKRLMISDQYKHYC